MPAETVGQYIQEDRSQFLSDHIHFPAIGIDHGQGIVTIHTLCMHIMLVQGCTYTGSNLVPHGFTTGLSTHPVLVVHDVEDQGQSAFHIPFP